MAKITNNLNISLPLALWLASDDYDFIDQPNYISVTKLMRPLKHIILPGRIPAEQRSIDLSDLIASRLGSSIHDSIEKSWINDPKRQAAMKLLGYSEDIIQAIKVNHDPAKIIEDDIPVYIEQRLFAKVIVNNIEWTIGGKFDMVTDGIINDTKTTSAYAMIYGSRDDEHALQMSLYKYLDSKQPYPRITANVGHINYVFTDWSKAEARRNPNYPQLRVSQKTLPLLPMDTVHNYIVNKIKNIMQFYNCSEDSIPECTDEELWRSAPSYKYYADPSKAYIPGARSSKNFESLYEAEQYKNEKGKGIVITKKSEPKRCGYCEAFDICTQKDRYFNESQSSYKPLFE